MAHTAAQQPAGQTMASTVFESQIFRDAFGTAEMRAVFSDQATIARYIEVEVALAAVEGRLGVIPKKAATAIAKLADASTIDLAELKEKTDLVG
jgi:3-carboxy-cis,cis-muconate cycloisomerase